jgi:hypothetical protein
MLFAARAPSVTAASPVELVRDVLASPVALAPIENDLDASNTGEAHRQIAVERSFAPRNDEEVQDVGRRARHVSSLSTSRRADSKDAGEQIGCHSRE